MRTPQDHPLYVAIDLGAGSGRVMLVDLAPGQLSLHEARRFSTAPRRSDGHLRWPWARIIEEIGQGLRTAVSQAGELQRSITSVGACSWGVDYGLLDADGTLIEEPICYRDPRTDGLAEQVAGRVPLVERTGVQVLPFNTVFQLQAHVRDGLPSAAERLLMIPDLIHHWLTGASVTEATNASTTQLFSPTTQAWDDELFTTLGLPRRLMAPLVPAGARLGALRPALRASLGELQVVAPATHDTASAVAGTPLSPGWAYISSGTWSLVGIERTRPLIDRGVVEENFTNEGGAFGTVRFLKNVMGLWLLERCRDEWQRDGHRIELSTLLAAVAERGAPGALIFPDHPDLLNPPIMVEALCRQLAETGQPVSREPVDLAKIVLDSLALRYASVVRRIQRLTGSPVLGLQVVGGGSQNDHLNQATATACDRPVLAGPVEATALGNAIVQAISAGRFADLSAARACVARERPCRRFDPRPDAGWREASLRYELLESRLSR